MAGKSTDSDPIHLRGVPVAIEGIENQPLLVIKSLPWSLGLFLNTSSNEAFFKLRIPLSLRDGPKTQIYLYIWPQQISSLTKEECTVPDSVAHVFDRLTSRGTARLRFKLDRPAVLVVPKKWPLAPDTESDRQTLAYAQALAVQTELALCIPLDLLPPRLSQILGEEWHGGSWKSSLDHARLDTLYGGSGGLIHADDVALPSYDDVSQGELPLSPGVLGKRRRMSGERAIGEDEADIERICARLIERHQAGLHDELLKCRTSLLEMSEASRETRKWVGEQLKDVEKQCRAHLDERIAEVQRDHQVKFLAIDSRLRDLDRACQERHGKLDRQMDDLERHINDRVWVEVNDLRTSIYGDFDDLKREHEEFIRDETNNAMGELKLTLSDSEVSLVGGRLEIT